MRVVFLEDVEGVAQGGDVKEVKNGFARNYLIPKQLAIPATKSAMQRIERLGRESDSKRVARLKDMREFAVELDGTRVDVEMRAGPNGRLYGSVTDAIIAEKLTEATSYEVDRRTVDVPEPIREIGVFDLSMRLHPDVDASIQVLVYPTGTDPEDLLRSDDDEVDADEAAEDGEENGGADDSESIELESADDTDEVSQAEAGPSESRDSEELDEGEESEEDS